MKKRSRLLVHLIWVLVALVAGGVGWWAASSVTKPVVSESVPQQRATYTVGAGKIGQQVSAQGKVSFDTARSLYSGTSGVVTAVSLDPSVPLTPGDVLLTVDLRPVVVAQGAVPAFRDLYRGARGPDVAQLRSFLKLPDGNLFDRSTEDAVKAWQKTVGVKIGGVVHYGDIVFVPQLPTRGFLADGIEVGSTIAVGDGLLIIAQASPTISLDGDSQGQILTGMTASLTVPDGGVVTGVLSGPFRGEDGLERFNLVNQDGESPCALSCAEQFPVTASSRVSVQVDVLPTSTGLVVPHSALVGLPDGSTGVRLTMGQLQPITVLQQGPGTSIIDGVAEGTVIELFGEPDSTAQDPETEESNPPETD